MYARPTPQETDEDILHLQQIFLQNKSKEAVKIAAKVVKTNPNTELNDEQTPEAAAKVLEPISNTFETIPVDIQIGKVIEKRVPPLQVTNMQMGTFPHSRGFPAVKRREHTAGESKGSIFSQQMKKGRIEQAAALQQPTASSSTERNVPDQSYIISSAFREEIHQENVNVLKGMTEEEIVEERNRLLNTMDPAIVAFLKSRRNQPTQKMDVPNVEEKNRAGEQISLDEIVVSNAIIHHPDSERWLNFDVVELNKLAWMKDVDVPALKNQSYEARFDFAGWLLPFTQPMTEENRNLYYHGEEAGRPGYTLQELFQLSRSSVTQQKIVALNTIGNVLALQQSGVYDNIIDIPLEQVFFVLRFCVDDNTPPVLNAAVKAMRNLVYYQIDEVCLDSLLGFGVGMTQPVLAINKDDKEDDRTLNDQQLVESDLIKCLIRTDMLKRLRYIIDNIRPPIETVAYCIEILIRFARDSNFVVSQICNYKDLIDSIIEHFVPADFRAKSDGAYGVPITQAVKLLRILICRSRNFAHTITTRYKIMERFANYLSNEQLSLNMNGLKLQVECLNTWSALTHYQLAIEEFQQVETILMGIFHFHVSNTNLSSSYTRQAHAAALLNLFSQIAQFKSIKELMPLFGTASRKWIMQLKQLEITECGKLQIISALFNCLTQFCKYRKDINLPMDKIEELLIVMMNSAGFKIITSNIKCGSNLLNNLQVHESGANLKTCEGAVWSAYNHLIPILQPNSCTPFLTALSTFIVTLQHQPSTLAFLQHPNINQYLNAIQQGPCHLVSNWFTQIECQLIMNALKMSLDVNRQVETSAFYELAVKSLSIFNVRQKRDVKHILEKIIFNSDYYPCELFLRNLKLNDQYNIEEFSFAQFQSFFNVYCKALGLNQIDDESKLSHDCSEGSFIPVDWIYSPLVMFYSYYQQQLTTTVDEQHLIVNCLRWIYIYETCFPSLAHLIDATDQYCRICCTFLGSDSLFLDPDVHSVLQAILTKIFQSRLNDIDFDRSITGINNFQDFYTQLLEQYQAVSYGDVCFGNYILIPLMQKHNLKFRKTLWSEYAGIVQIFNINEQLVWPLELFLYPVEEDVSLLKCYQKVLRMGAIRRHSILYTIATHHLQQCKVKSK